MPRSGSRLLRTAVVVLLCVTATTAPVRAQVLLDKLDQIDGVGITEKRGQEIPLDLAFTDSRGRDVTLAEFFDGKRPVLLVMAYYDCPLLCTLVLNRTQTALNSLAWTAGEEYRVLTVSFDFRDTTKQARDTQMSYLAGYNREIDESAWSFLTGETESIRALAGAVGYRYKYLPDIGEFSHPAALIFLTPDGHVSTYLEKLEYPAAEVKQALAEAAEGKIGSIFDRVAHFCFRYDPKTGAYTARVMNIMRLGATGGAVALGLFIAILWVRSGRTPALSSAAGAETRTPRRGQLAG